MLCCVETPTARRSEPWQKQAGVQDAGTPGQLPRGQLQIIRKGAWRPPAATPPWTGDVCSLCSGGCLPLTRASPQAGVMAGVALPVAFPGPGWCRGQGLPGAGRTALQCGTHPALFVPDSS